MLKSTLKIFIISCIIVTAITVDAQNEPDISHLALFTDRDFCVSGDTVWYKIKLDTGPNDVSNIVHVQLVSGKNNLISTAINKCKNGWLDGYLHVPDSLSTGVYFISSFLNSQRNIPDVKLQNRSLFVYNRFEQKIDVLNIPCQNQVLLPQDFNDKIDIQTNKESFKSREKVYVKLDFAQIDTNELSEVVVKASVVDQLAMTAGGIFFTEMETTKKTNSYQEKDGVLITGMVTNNITGERQPNVVVGLSITGEMPYFDYCCSDEDGRFFFFLKNAEGIATIYLQAISQEPEKYKIQLEENYLHKKDNICFESGIITKKQSDFIMDVIDARYFSKLFHGTYFVQNYDFKMPPRFNEPFYGKPKNHIILNDYLSLNNFQEISRELFPGVQYREKRGEVSINLLNYEQNQFFLDEPLRLINGIPVFENSLFSNFKSSDIEYIDYVLAERVFGDMVFYGVISVYLNDRSNSWQIQQPQIRSYDVACIQFDKNPGYQDFSINDDNLPDFRNVFLWECLYAEKSKELEFYLSDVIGKVEISVKGVTNNNTMIKASKIIEVE